MSYQLIPEPDVESLLLQTVQQCRDAEKMLYDMLGYRGSFSTTQHGSGGVITESARLDLVADGKVPVSTGTGEVIVYRASPPEVVACMTQAQFDVTYQQKP
jgi:hypothetical protein